MNVVGWLFWIFLFVVVYTFVGYGVLMYLWRKLFVKNVSVCSAPDYEPEVTLLIAAYNEEAYIADKMRNTLEIDYPKDKFHVVWVTDGSNDNSGELLKQYESVTLYHQPQRQGKTMAINRVMPMITDPIVVFTDANTMLNKEAIRELVAPFSNPKVGCVAGEKRILVNEYDVAVASGEGFYWKYESFLKKLDSDINTTMGAAGELYAVRRELFGDVDPTLLLDDFMLSMEIASEGYKIVYCPTAYAMESASLDIKEEAKRKKRIAAGGLQSVWRLRRLLNPFRYGLLTFQYVSHRVLRWTITPVLLLALLPLNIALVCGTDCFIYKLLLAGQLLFYLFAMVGYLLQQRAVKKQMFFVPYYFLFMNMNVFSGVAYLMKRKGSLGMWEKARRVK